MHCGFKMVTLMETKIEQLKALYKGIGFGHNMQRIEIGQLFC